MHPIRTTLVTMFALAVSVPAGAQEPAAADGHVADALRQGRRSLTFRVPNGGGGSVAFWSMRSDRTNLGIEAALLGSLRTFGADRSQTDWDVRVGPAIKRYLTKETSLAPFAYGNAFLSYERERIANGGVVGTANRLGGGTSAGVGVEWFPTARVSIGGQTGVTVRYLWRDAGGNPSVHEFVMHTFASALGVQFYFGGPGGRADPAVTQP